MLYSPLKSNIYLSGMSCISFKEIAFLTIINLKSARGSQPLDPLGGITAPHPNPQLFLPRFAPFTRASSLRSEGLPRFLLISVLMPVWWRSYRFLLYRCLFRNILAVIFLNLVERSFHKFNFLWSCRDIRNKRESVISARPEHTLFRIRAILY